MPSETLKIVYVTPALYMAGGVERVLTLKANYFAEQYGYDITIILTEGKGKPLFYPLSEKVKVVNLDINFEQLWGCPFLKKGLLYLKKQRQFKKRLTHELMRLHADLTIILLRREINFICDIPNKEVFDYLVIEVSEVQGWGTDLMKNHALIMSSAINPDVGVVTNVTMDHIGLVNSIEEVFEETSGVVKATGKGGIVLNFDDENVLAMKEFVNEGVDTYFTSMDKLAIEEYEVENNKKVYFDSDKKVILYDGEAILTFEELPFTGDHFIRNILSAISACISLEIPIDDIVDGVKTYRPLSRRFTRLYDEPIVIDDFAHNPDGIKNTVRATYDLAEQLDKGDLYIACAIRGSRGETLNGLNSEALAEVIKELRHRNDDLIEKDSGAKKREIYLSLSSSEDLVDHLNYVEDFEKDIFFANLNKEHIKYNHFEKLYDALGHIMETATKDDVVLLIGAQGMDPASDVLKDILGH